MMFADLHVHTNLSDGTFTPEQAVREARQRDLSCIAITDHDTVYALGPALKESSNFNVEVIPGVELTTEIDDYEIHILGYFIDWQAEWFKKRLEQLCNMRRERALEMIKRLKEFGIELNPDELIQEAGPGSIGRLHIARLLQKKGYVLAIQDAFNRYIGENRPCYVRRLRLTPAEAINMVIDLKGLAVLAHPYTIGNDEFIPKLARSGLRGIEVYYPEHTRAATEHYQNLAQKYGLLVTGGSDCHGLGKDKVLMGEVKIPYSLVEILKKEVEILRGGER